MKVLEHIRNGSTASDLIEAYDKDSWPRGDYEFETNCIASDGRSINDMRDGAEEITRKEFLKYVDRRSVEDIEREIGYDDDFPMAKDWHVSYHRSFYRGRPCVYFVWSAIEYVFTSRRARYSSRESVSEGYGGPKWFTFEVGQRVLALGLPFKPETHGKMEGTVIKVTPRRLAGGVRAVVRVLWDSGYEALENDRSLVPVSEI